MIYICVEPIVAIFETEVVPGSHYIGDMTLQHILGPHVTFTVTSPKSVTVVKAYNGSRLEPKVISQYVAYGTLQCHLFLSEPGVCRIERACSKSDAMVVTK